MKQCPICQQRYSDAVNFCAKDGGLLEPLTDVKAVDVVHAPAPVPVVEPLTAAVELAPPPAKKPILGYVVAVLLAAACVVGAMAIVKQMNANSDLKTHQDELLKQQAATDKTAIDKAFADKATKAQTDAVFAAKLKADADRSMPLSNPFETRKAETSPIVNSNAMLDGGDIAMLKSRGNVRSGLNGAVLCVLPANATIRILGAAGTTSDDSGRDTMWHYTDACGKAGVVAAPLLVFLN